MRAVQVVRHDEPGRAVEVTDVEVPAPGEDSVLVKVSAASLNFGDIARCRGGVASVLPELPFTLGMDVCGVVESGPEPWVGQRVVAITQMAVGGMAEYAVAPLTSLFPAPAGLDDAEATAFLLPFHTTFLALHDRAGLAPGETVLITAGASALGTAAIQIAAAAGAKVIAVAGSDEKAALCRSLGAGLTLVAGDGGIFDAVMDATGDRGAEVVLDLVGGPGTEALWTCVAYGGRYLPVGFNDDPEAGMTGRPLRKVSMGNFSVVGVLLAYGPPSRFMRQFGVVTHPPEVGRRIHRQLCHLLADGLIRPHIGRRITPAEVAGALEDHAARRTTGRTVVVFD